MAMVDLAANGNGRPIALAEVARRQEISLSYLEQLFVRLRRNGLVSAARGPGGGYRLSQPAAEMRIADIVLAVDEPLEATRCRAGSGRGCMTGQGRCMTHELWEALGNEIQRFLASVTLADVVERRIGSDAAPPRATAAAE